MFEPWPSALLPESWLKQHGLAGHKGVAVWDVSAGGPADQAGLKEGDAIVSLNGAPLPLPEKIDPEDRLGYGERFEQNREAVWAKIHAGDKVVLAVERGGKPMTIEIVATDEATRDRIAQALEEESDARDPPNFLSAGIPVASAFTFERLPEGKMRPDPFFVVLGTWEVAPEEGATSDNHVLGQSARLLADGVCLVTGTGRACPNGTLSARFAIGSGTKDPAAGVVFRAKDRKNLYLLRAGANDSSFRLVRTKEGVEKELGSATVLKPALGSWHAIEVTFAGPKIKATLDGKAAVEATDDSFASGWCGVWTRGDTSASFDDVKITPAK
jgi:hypothetical protein